VAQVARAKAKPHTCAIGGKMNPNLISVSISVSLMANAILFTIYINGHRDKTAKGIFLLTVIYAIIAMIFKYY
jgi:hypothetical protein